MTIFFVQARERTERDDSQQNMGLSGPPPTLPDRPPLDNNSSNLPVVGQDGRSTPAGPRGSRGKIKALTSQRGNSCDPFIEIEFYRKMEYYLCLKSPSASCPESMETWLKKYGGEAIAASVGALMMLTYQIPGLLEELNLKNTITTGQTAQQLQAAKGIVAELLSKAEIEDGARAILKQSLEAPGEKQFKQILSQLAKQPELIRALEVFPKTIKSKTMIYGMILGGLMGQILSKLEGYANVFSNSAPTGCEGNIDRYMSEDPKDQCRKKFILDDRVAMFLSLPHEQRLDLLNTNPELCDYYRQFNEQLTKWIGPNRKISNVQCSIDGASSYEVDKDGEKFLIKVSTTATKDLSGIDVTRMTTEPASTLHINHFQAMFTSDGTSSSINKVTFQTLGSKREPPRQIDWNYKKLIEAEPNDSYWWTTGKHYPAQFWQPTILSILSLSKLNSTLVSTCCGIQDSTKKDQCVHMIENPSAKSIDELTKSIHSIDQKPPPAQSPSDSSI